MQNSLTQIPLKEAMTIAERLTKHIKGITKENYLKHKERFILALMKFSREKKITQSKKLYEYFIFSDAFDKYTKEHGLVYGGKDAVYFFDETEITIKICVIWEKKGINTNNKLCRGLIKETLQDLIKQQKSEQEVLEYFRNHYSLKTLFA